MIFSYHNHTNWSDGRGTISEIIAAAGEAGIDEIGISDHYVLTVEGQNLDWSIPLESVSEYVADVQESAGSAADGLIVRLGLEADYIPETIDGLRSVLFSEPFDYIIGAVHYVEGFPIDYSEDDWKPLSQKDRDEIIRKYWILIKRMAETGLFDIAAHLDLYKKFAIYPSIDLGNEISDALDAIARAGMSVELNTAGWYMPCNEAYPSQHVLNGCFKRGIPVLVCSDAHDPVNISRGFEHALGLLRSAGYTEFSSYAGRERIAQAIP